MNRVDLIQLGGHVTNPEDQHTVVRDRGSKARHVRQDRLARVSDRTKWRAKLEESWRPTTLAVVMRNEKSWSHLAHVADLAITSWWKSGSDMSFDLERVGNLANSVSTHRSSFFFCVLVKGGMEF